MATMVHIRVAADAQDDVVVERHFRDSKAVSWVRTLHPGAEHVDFVWDGSTLSVREKGLLPADTAHAHHHHTPKGTP